MIRRPPISPLFPYTTLFRSRRELKDSAAEESQLTLDGMGPSEEDLAREAAHADVLKAVAVNDLSDALESVLGQRGGDALPGGMELPLTFVLARMEQRGDRKSTRLNSSHANISYAVFCLKKKSIT